MVIKAEPSFSLKDQLFNKQKVQLIAGEITAVYPEFQTKQFIKMVVARLPELELLERLYWIRDCLQVFLPDDYRWAASILVKSLPTPNNPALSDGDFGDFIYGPYGAFVAHYGCVKKDLQFSLQTLRAMTTRFSVEFPIRSFINAFPVETMDFLLDCSSDTHYHVRRLASEGTRGKLPWAKNVTIEYQEPLSILDILYADNTRYVTRSVANHMNDISKVDSELVVKTLKRWKQAGKQNPTEMQFIIRHSLRTLEKQGHAGALKLLGYGEVLIELSSLHLESNQVTIGDSLEFSFSITSTATVTQGLLIDYHLYFQKSNGALTPKTFKITKMAIKAGETLSFSKQQPLRPMTTRVLHPGKHEIELQINGKTYPKVGFELVV